jgi:CheY-like chemotaxis protein/signal transduction histidine kinase
VTNQRPKENLFARNATLIAIVTVTLAVAAAAGLFWMQGLATTEAKGWVDHTYMVRRHVALLYRGLLDAETSQRGYLLTGNPDFLQPYRAAVDDATGPHISDPEFELRRSVRQEMAILRALTRDNPEQQANLDELDQVATAVQAYFAQTIRQRAALPKGPVADLAAFDMDHGRTLMDQLRTEVLLVDAEENHLLKQRTEVNRNNDTRNTWLTGIITFLLYVGIIAAVWAYQRSRAKAQAETLLYTQELEKREEELKQQQEELKASNEEIEASNEELEEKTAALEEQNTRILEQARVIEQANKLIEEKASEVEQSSKYKSEFLANMSHELRTPLNSLLILARGFASNEQGNLTEEQIEEARVIHNGGLELLGLINDILDLSKVEAGKISIVQEDVYVSGIVKRLTQSFEPVARERGVAFRIESGDGLPEMIHTDAQRVEQILKNLLSNAFKFTEKGSVTLDVRPAADDADLHKLAAGRGVIALSVIDTGIGIEESKLRDIFEAFQQEDGSIDRHYGGTGLGLTIARKFAHILGGEIHVASKKGKGSTFTLYLPVAQDGQTVPAVPAPKPAPAELAKPSKTSLRQFIPDDRKSVTAGDTSGDKVLLVIEDDRDFAMTLMKTARKRGYKVLGAGDGKSGLLLASEYPVTAIILDLRLPDMNGLMVLDQLKHALNTRHIPVHIISGDDSGGTIGPLRKGAIGYLLKPVQEEDIDGAFSRIEGLLNAEVKKVLVVEDDKTTQTAIRSLLKTKNIEIVVAGTGETALKQVKSEAFDCIILDLSLPDMTGFEWLEAVEKAAGEDGLAPVIIYTARDLTEDENRSLSRYTDSIVIKGVSSSERLLDEVTLFLHSVESNLSKDQQATLRMHHDPDRALQNRTVLLVDDDMRNTFALSKLLKKHGLNLVIADNGQMALDKLKENRDIDLIIMDIMMPVMDGYQAMREIRKVPGWARLPIIALTARAMPEEVDKCMEAGANDYMMKPVDIDRLLTLLRVWLFKQEKVA